MLIRARFVVPVDGPPIENGALVIHDGIIQAVGSAERLHDTPVIGYGESVVCPGFVNAHTHLELSHLAGKLSPCAGFTTWVKQLVQLLRANPPTQEQVRQTLQSAIRSLVRNGVTTVGDITRHPGWTRPVLAQSPLRAVSFGEVIAVGPLREQLAHRLEASISNSHATDRMRTGISPHTPYTVEPMGLRMCGVAASEFSAPLCIHLAETAEESLYTQFGTGALVDLLRDIGAWDEDVPISGRSPVDLASACGVLGPRTVIAHANFVNDVDLTTLANCDASVAYCPRTHSAFGHPPHLFRKMLGLGINVCIGTDSLASNPSLSVLEELRHLRHMHPGFLTNELLAMGTIRGAKALGFGELTGTLAPGKSADIIVIPLTPSGSQPRWDDFLQDDTMPRAVYSNGVSVWCD